jgi:GNAT superfamily N-acetyltransferase
MTRSEATDEVVVRQAEERDLDRVVELFELGSLVEGKEDRSDLRPYAAALSEIAARPGGLLVAQSGGLVVGVCQLIVFRHLQAGGGLCAEIESVHVHPDWRGQGIGRLLMGSAVDRAGALGCYRVQLTSNNQRTEAHRFYESLGFEATHQGFKLVLR